MRKVERYKFEANKKKRKEFPRFPPVDFVIASARQSVIVTSSWSIKEPIKKNCKQSIQLFHFYFLSFFFFCGFRLSKKRLQERSFEKFRRV